ncbi:MAG: hypothetical protein ABIO81_11610 [Ginsengibacter sp.]
MAINLVESVQKKLKVDELQKIDPDTGKIKDDQLINPSNLFYQLAIPAILTGFYKYTRLDEGNRDILNMQTGNFISSIFDEHTQGVISKIADITKTPQDETRHKMEKIAEATMITLKENLTGTSSDSHIKDLLTAQRHNILLYLDPSLQIGHYINDNTVDDSTTKMEGPVSDLVNKIGQIFSGSGNDEKKKI